LASNTAAQQQFLQVHSDHGSCVSIQQLQDTLRKLEQQKEVIRANAHTRYQAAAGNDAASELEQLAVCWKQLIQQKS
jgi:hypothetical protein